MTWIPKAIRLSSCRLRKFAVASVALGTIAIGVLSCEIDSKIQYQCDTLFICEAGVVYLQEGEVTCSESECEERCGAERRVAGQCPGGCLEEGGTSDEDALCAPTPPGGGGGQGGQGGQMGSFYDCDQRYYCESGEIFQSPSGVFCGNRECGPEDCRIDADFVSTCQGSCESGQLSPNIDEICVIAGGAGGQGG